MLVVEGKQIKEEEEAEEEEGTEMFTTTNPPVLAVYVQVLRQGGEGIRQALICMGHEVEVGGGWMSLVQDILEVVLPGR